MAEIISVLIRRREGFFRMGKRRNWKTPDSLEKIMAQIAEEDGLSEMAKMYRLKPEPLNDELSSWLWLRKSSLRHYASIGGKRIKGRSG